MESRGDKATVNIISASRRTDIPAFYMPWLMNRIQAGFACYPNPFSGQVYEVSLRPADVHSIVFWSKNYRPLLGHLDELKKRDYKFYFHYTITGAPQFWEPYVPDWREAAEIFRKLAEQTSPRHVQWRFDPIIFTNTQGFDSYVERFREIAKTLVGVTERCYFSFGAFYGKVQQRLRRAHIQFFDPSTHEKLLLAKALADIASRYSITLYTCCQDALVTKNIKKAHCIDGELLADLFPDRPCISQQKPTRKQCGCVASRDIGMYDTCLHGCIYCYANQHREVTLRQFKSHTPTGEMLTNYVAGP
jgi:hypothetical protein